MRKTHGFYKDLDKAELLRMREEGMSDSQIGAKLGVSYSTVYDLIGPMPAEMRAWKRKEFGAMGGRKSGANRAAALEIEETPVQETIEAPEEIKPTEPERKRVLAVKPSELHLWGDFGCYTVTEKRDQIDVENSEGRVLLNIPAEKLDVFIEELQAIARNLAGSKQRVEMW